MYNGFSCYQRRRKDRDLRITSIVRITEREENLELEIIWTKDEKSGSKFKRQSKRKIILPEIAVDQVVEIADLIKRWLLSESHPGMAIEDTDVDGIYSFEKEADYPRNQITGEKEFTGIKVTINRQYVKFSFWDEDSTEWIDISIPCAENYEYEVPGDIKNAKKLYDTFYDFFTSEFSGQVDNFQENDAISPEMSTIHRIEQIFNRFGEIVIPLKERRSQREPLRINDEYDVQYLLHALLKIHFDDVRREPHTERHSSVSPRIDFLIQNETIGIEVKYASGSSPEKKLRNELAEDKEQYRLDTNIETLLIFVYDPDKQIENKAEFEDSFEQKTSEMETRVTVTR